MSTGQTVFAQLMQLAPCEAFGKAVRAYQGNRGVRSFPCWSQFLCMAYAQLTGRSSLRDIETCLNAHPERLDHMGFRGTITRSTLAEANENRDFRIYSCNSWTCVGTCAARKD